MYCSDGEPQICGGYEGEDVEGSGDYYSNSDDEVPSSKCYRYNTALDTWTTSMKEDKSIPRHKLQLCLVPQNTRSSQELPCRLHLSQSNQTSLSRISFNIKIIQPFPYIPSKLPAPRHNDPNRSCSSAKLVQCYEGKRIC